MWNIKEEIFKDCFSFNFFLIVCNNISRYCFYSIFNLGERKTLFSKNLTDPKPLKSRVCVGRQQFNEKSLNQGYLQEVTSHLCRGRGMDIHSQAKVMSACLIYTLFISGFFHANRKRVLKHSLTHTFISLSRLSHTNKCPLTSLNSHSE